MTIETFLEQLSGERAIRLGELFSHFPHDVPVTCYELDADALIVRQGSPCTSVYVLLDGRARTVIHQFDASTHAYSDFYALEFFCEYEILAGMEHILADVRAQSACTILAFSAEGYLRWMLGDPHRFLTRVRSILQTLLRQTAQGRSSLYLSALDRIKQFLIDYYVRHQTGTAPSPVLVGQIRASIGEELGFSVRTVNRAVHTLLQEQKIGLYKGKITLTHSQYESMRLEIEALTQAVSPNIQEASHG